MYIYACKCKRKVQYARKPTCEIAVLNRNAPCADGLNAAKQALAASIDHTLSLTVLVCVRSGSRSVVALKEANASPGTARNGSNWSGNREDTSSVCSVYRLISSVHKWL